MARTPLHGEPGSASSGHALVRCEARHSQGRGETRRADDFRNVYKATQRKIIRSGNLSAQAIQEMGFHPDDIGRALVLASFSFDKALLLLLNGIDVKRTKQDSNPRYDSVGFRPARRPNLWCVLLALLGSWFGGKQGRRVDPGSATSARCVLVFGQIATRGRSGVFARPAAHRLGHAR